MKYEVVKKLKYSHDGINVVDFVKGDILETSNSENALIKEGYLKKVEVKKPEPKKEAPPSNIKETKEVDDLENSKPVQGLRVRNKDK